MQTFLPYPSYERSARVLDSVRLGNQCYREAKTLLGGGWKNHPAARMWKGYEHHLSLYGLACACEMAARPGRWRDEVVTRWIDYWTQQAAQHRDTGAPPWLGDESLHLSHRMALIYKDATHYGRIWPDLPAAVPNESGKLPYVWPV